MTEGVRRAIQVWKFLQDQQDKGNDFVVVESDGRVRHIVLL